MNPVGAEKRQGYRLPRFGRGSYVRVLKMARKPTRDEYRRMVIVTSIGLFILGGLGYAIYILMSFIPQGPR
jgi:protein transport protein SEC61 subunit gamma-like protein